MGDNVKKQHISSNERIRWDKCIVDLDTHTGAGGTVNHPLGNGSVPGFSTNDYTVAERNKLAGIAPGATNYVHPSTHPASMITGLATVATSGSYNSLSDRPSMANGSTAGFSTNDYSTAEKNKLAGIANNANNYVHPSTHPASMITGLATVATSGSYKNLVDRPSMANGSTAGFSTNDYSTAERNKLAGIVPGATNYVHPSTHPASMITGLAAIATSGDYSTLINKPTSIAANGGNADTVSGGIRITISPNAPSNPVVNKELWINTNDNVPYIYKSYGWQGTNGMWA